MKRNIIGVITSALIFMLIGFWAGLLIGAYIGGNYMVDFEFAGVRGYEAVGNIGMIVGAFFGLIFGTGVGLKRDAKTSKS